jgi:hypothetical protein
VSGAEEGDAAVFRQLAEVLRPGGRLALSAFSAYYQVRYLGEGDDFDAASGVNHEHTEVRGPDGRPLPAELWTTCYTPRELRLLARSAGLEVDAVWSVAPGEYAAGRPVLDRPEFLLLARRPA